MRRLFLLLAAALATPAAAQGVATTASGQPDQQKLLACDASATAQALTGYRRGLFISECLEAKPSAAQERKAGAGSGRKGSAGATQTQTQPQAIPPKPKPKPKPKPRPKPPEADEVPDEAPQ
jgi:cell division septation protein DedD